MIRTTNLLAGIFSFLLVYNCAALKKPDISGDDIRVTWGVLENNYQGKSQNRSRFIIKNEGNRKLPSTGWKMYYNSFRPVRSADTTLVNFRHISGDFFEMAPADSFPPLAPGDSVIIDFTSAHWVINKSDAPSGLYFAFEDGRTEKPSAYTILPFTDESHTIRNSNDNMPLATPERIYKQDRHLSVLDKESLTPVVPEPVSYRQGNRTVSITNSSHKLRFDADLESEARHLKDALAVFGLSLEDAGSNYSGPAIELNLSTEAKRRESYSLTVQDDDTITINGSDAAGVFYGIQSFISLIPAEEYTDNDASVSVQEVTIEDYPRFRHRGMFLDVSRNFQTKETILKLLNLMAHYKLNKFHVHLADDEGWRIEIPGLPELTDVGSRRGHTLEERHMLHPSYGSGPAVDASDNHGTGFYSVEDYIDILKYAARHHIEVIPEIDVPGHARAAIKAMLARYHNLMDQGKPEAAKQYLLTDLDDESVYRSVQNYDDNAINPCRESTYSFMEKVIDEIQDIYKKAGVPLTTFHVGGDEVPLGVWAQSPSCLKKFPNRDASQMKHDAYIFFVDSLSTIIENKGLNIGGWEDIGVSTENGKHVPNKKLSDKKMVLNTWNSIWGGHSEDLAYQLANAGFEVILSNATNYYFDMAIHKHPQEPGLYWAAFVDTKNVFESTPMDIFRSAYVSLMGDTLHDSQWKDKTRLTPTGRQNIKGIQGQLWSETVRGQDRMEYMVFPRMVALAQRAWSPQPDFAVIEDRKQRETVRDEAWNTFANVLGQYQLPKLDYLARGVNYNIPAPGAVIENDLLKASVTYPGLTIQYTTDGSEPSLSSPVYTEPVKVSEPVKLKTFTTDGRSSRTVQVK